MAADDDSFVSIGTAFDVPDEDAPKKKALPVHEQYATDSEGRRRFHGAFTGGFSAGYFNTVGSKEGWKPSTFVSSRSKRYESSRQNPEDFMDEEDLAEFGIAPRNVETTKLFSREQETNTQKRNMPVTSVTADSFDSMMISALQDLVVPCRLSIGVRLLKKMGWKEGQGIGPRVRQLPKKKVYGCVLPPGSVADAKHDDYHDIYADGLLFAPKDTTTVKFTPKDNLHGIGYKGMLAPRPMESLKPGFSGNLKIKGQAFGVGAFEDDDEDIYTQDSISKYDIELCDRKPQHADLRTRTGTSEQDIGGALSVFAKASKAKPANKVFVPPPIPKGYQPFVNIKETYDVKKDESSVGNLTSDTRGKLLGEQQLQKTTKSVFDMMSVEDRERIASTTKTLQTNSAVVKNYSQQRENVRAVGFRPFAKDEAKQARYESFLESRTSENKSNTSNEQRCGLTEWEREREKEEFTRAAMLYQPLKGDIAARFTRGRNIDDDINDKSSVQPTNNEKPVEEKAAEMKMFGMMTRKTFEWHPSKLLCKRFNIPEPYPSSSKTGLVCEKGKKFSLGQLFEKDKRSEGTNLNEPKKILNNSNTDSGAKVISRNLNTDENVTNSSIPSSSIAFDQKESSKPSMDLFKAIFANSSEDDSGNSEDEGLKDEEISHTLPAEISTTDVITVSEHQQSSHGKFDVTYKDNGIYKFSGRTNVKTSDNEVVKAVAEQINTEQNVMEENDEYGPRPPSHRSLREDSDLTLEYRSRQTVPFSRYDSNSGSESDKPKREHKKKQKRKSKHKNKDKDRNKEKQKDKSRKTEREKASKNNQEIPSNSLEQSFGGHEQTNKSKQKEIPDDKQILSKLKAVQKRRMCAADFM